MESYSTYRQICRYLRVFSYMVSTFVVIYVILAPSMIIFVVIYVILAPHIRDTTPHGLLMSNFVDRRVTLDYVKRDAAHFCRYLRDPRLRKKRRGAFLSLFTVLQSIMTEMPAIFVVIYATFASMTCDARHFCRSLRDPSLRKKRYASHLSLFTGL